MKKQAAGEKEEFVVDSGGYVVDAAGEAERADSGRSEAATSEERERGSRATSAIEGAAEIASTRDRYSSLEPRGDRLRFL